VQRVVDAQRRHTRFLRVVASSGGHHIDRQRCEGRTRQLAHQLRCQICRGGRLRIGDVGPGLQIARILRTLSAHQARLIGGDPESRRLVVTHRGDLADQVLHRLGVLAERLGVGHQIASLSVGQGLEVRDEGALLRQIPLGLLVVAAMDGIVGTLEEQLLAVHHILAGQPALIAEAGRCLLERRADGGGRDVVLGLHLDRRAEVGAQAEQPPAVVGQEPDAQLVDQDLLALQPHGVARASVHDADTEVAAPVGAPFGLVVALDGEQQLLDVRGDRAQEGVVLGGVLAARSEQLDDRAERALRRQDRTTVLSVAVAVEETIGVVGVQQLLNTLHIGGEISRIGIAEDERVSQRLADLGLAAARHGRGLVAVGRDGGDADQMPLGLVHLAVLRVDPVAVRRDVDLAGEQLDGLFGAGRVGPGDGLLAHGVVGAAGHQDDVRLDAVERVTLRLQFETLRITGQHIGDGVVGWGVLVMEFRTQVVGRVDPGTAGMLLLGAAEQVRSVGQLSLDFLLAVTEVVVRDDGDHDAALVASAALEGVAAVVELVLVLPALAITALTLGGVVPVRHAEAPLGDLGEVRGEDDTSGVTRPGGRIQRRIVLRKLRVAGVAEDAFDEVEVADQAAGDDEAGLHGLGAATSGHRRHHQRAQQQRHEAGRRVRLVRGVGQDHVFARRLHGQREQPGEHILADDDLVVRNGQAAFCNVEDTGGGAAVVGRIVQHAIGQPVA